MKLEEWKTMNHKWCTPLMLSLMLNLMILTIFLTSRFDSRKKNLGRTSSSMLQRLKLTDMFQFPCITNKYNDDSTQKHALQLMKVDVNNRFELQEVNEEACKSLNERYIQQRIQLVKSESTFRNFRESEAVEDQLNEVKDAERSMDEVYSQLLKHQGSNMKMSNSDTVKIVKKSASSKFAFKPEARRPAKVKVKTKYDDEEVDSKADDFISMFKQQLKLQRVDSILRYKEMLDRGLATI